MTRKSVKLALLASSVLTLWACSPKAANPKVEPDKRPNILLIVVDDMGMADLGSFGSEIETPNLDALAYDGIRLTNFNASPVCSVTRSMLLTGVDANKAGLGNMAEDMAPNQEGQPGHEGKLNQNVVSVSTLLQDAGYRTYLSGKWHLGMSPDALPTARGFDNSFSMLSGGASHYGDMMPAYHPDPNGKAPYDRDGTRLTKLPDDFEYSTQYYVDQMIDYIGGGSGAGSEDTPFFAYLSYTAPHWPLQAPEATIAKYEGRYDGGFDSLRKERLARQKALGIVSKSATENPPPPKAVLWDRLTDTQKATETRSMEIYAAMVDEIDSHTGRLIDHLKKTGQFENTIIIFMSDNGAEGHDIDNTWPGDLYPDIRSNIDNKHDFSFENMGKPNSYVFYGPNWARAGAPNLRLHKGFPTEGGIRVPAFIHYEGFAKAKVTNRYFDVKDITPTLLDVLDIEHPSPLYEGRTVQPMTGLSMLPALTGNPERDDSRVSGGELMGKYYIRKGSWKMVHMPVPAGIGDWQLYNLNEDPSESQDRSESNPEIKQDLLKEWDAYYKANGVIIPNRVSGY